MQDFDPIAYINEPRWQESRLGLERITDLLERLGRPQDRLRFVHVAGTNGKGSTCAFLESILRHAGLVTGLFTSPYVIRFEERIRVNGKNISMAELTDVTRAVRDCAEAMASETGEHPTEFELMTAVAFEHFARSCCDIVVCEVGMGGRLDSTNIIESPEVCVIARIGLDHTEFLGDTTGKVAAEKAGIVKPGATVVSWPQDDEDAMGEVRAAAERCGVQVMLSDFSGLEVGSVGDDAMRPFTYKGVPYRTRLLGSYQPFNATLAIEAAECLRAKGWEISSDCIVSGIEQATWPGRFEVVSAGPPPVVVDGGHNPQGAEVLAQSLRDVFPGKRVAFVMSVLADKDYRSMIRSVLPLANSFSCVTPPNPRALDADDLARAILAEAAEAAEADLDEVSVKACSTYDEAFRQAREHAAPNGVVCAFGSLYAIAEIQSALTI